MSDQTTSERAIWWDEKREVFTTESMFSAIRARRKNPTPPRGLSTGWPLFNEFFSLRKKQLTVVSGIPNHGKSEFMDALMVNSILDHKWKWGVFSPENFPYDDHFEKIAEKFTEKPFSEISDNDVDFIVGKLKDYIFWSYFRSPTLAAIADVWKNLAITADLDAVLLDPWNTVEHKRPKEQSETEYIGEALSGWIDFARTMNVAVFIVAHPTKIPSNRETGVPYMMNAYDISGSANWVNKPDNVIIVQRPNFKEDTTHVHVQKVRDQRHTGKRGGVKFEYLPHKGGTYFAKEVLR